MLAYTLSRSERRGPGESAWRLLDYDQTHVATLAAEYRLQKASVGARVRYSTGMPRTPVAGAVFDTRSGLYRPIFGAQNSVRLPSFVELDLNARRAWSGRRATFALELDVINATSRANAEEVVYSGDYSHRDYVHGLPLLVLVGLRLEM
jgi:hypothetical protein